MVLRGQRAVTFLMLVNAVQCLLMLVNAEQGDYDGKFRHL